MLYEVITSKAQRRTDERGIDLFLPPVYAQVNGQRACSFIDDSAVFIDKDGQVMPCHFLWHTCPSRVNNSGIQVKKRVMGSIKKEPLEEIWHRITSYNVCYTKLLRCLGVWFLIYKHLEPLASYLTYSLLDIRKGSHLGDAIQFFARNNFV